VTQSQQKIESLDAELAPYRKKSELVHVSTHEREADINELKSKACDERLSTSQSQLEELNLQKSE
jgi:ribosomal protein L29